MQLYDLSGLWQADIGDGKTYPLYLPGTLDESGIGKAQEAVATRFTRKHAYTGEVKIRKKIFVKEFPGKRVLVEVERARCLRLFVNGQEAKRFVPQTLVSPQVFEVTGMLTGEDEFVFLSDNTYPGLPAGDILYSSAATDETQTNWNGLLGYVRMRVEEPVFVEAVRVYPKVDVPDTVTLCIELSAAVPWQGELFIRSDALREEAVVAVHIQPGKSCITAEPFILDKDVQYWDEDEGICYDLTVLANGLEPKTISFGVRSFGSDRAGRLTLNGRRIFLRSEANCAEFPESGHEPMTEQEWITILKRYRQYGVNCVRFHSHCPPDAAFIAADRLGMLMQPELSCWNPKDAFLAEEAYAYYRTELTELLRCFANHPSFVMLSFGNELWTDEEGHKRMRDMLGAAHAFDATRLIADGSNNHYGALGCEEESDFYAAQSFKGEPLRGTFANMEGYINHIYPGAKENFGKTMEKLRADYKKPVFGFEVGQFEVLPDFSELGYFCGVTEPQNLRMIKERVKEREIGEKEWQRMVEATGELALLCYREEVEAVLRTPEMSGISLLGLQDFPGQGTALVGMMNSHLLPKPYAFAQPGRFSVFFRASQPLVQLERYTYRNTECLSARVLFANYGKEAVCGTLCAALAGGTVSLKAGEAAGEICCPVGELTDVGVVSFDLSAFRESARLDLSVEIGGIVSSYPVWVYRLADPVCPEGVYETETFDLEAERVLSEGGTVFLAPPSDKESLPGSIKAQFSTDFWSVGTFGGQEGGMGQLIDSGHPLFRDFPTEFHTNWQWWAMATRRAVILPKGMKAIVAELDSYATLRPMAQLFECRVGGGKLFFSSLGLKDLLQYPECQVLLSCIYRYLASDEFDPGQQVEKEVIAGLTSRGTLVGSSPHVS